MLGPLEMRHQLAMLLLHQVSYEVDFEYPVRYNEEKTYLVSADNNTEYMYMHWHRQSNRDQCSPPWMGGRLFQARAVVLLKFESAAPVHARKRLRVMATCSSWSLFYRMANGSFQAQTTALSRSRIASQAHARKCSTSITAGSGQSSSRQTASSP